MQQPLTLWFASLYLENGIGTVGARHQLKEAMGN